MSRASRRRPRRSSASSASAFDAVLLDPALGDDDDTALALLHRMRQIAPDTVVVIWSEHPTVEFAVRAMRAGALDVLKKTADVAEIRSVVDRAISHGALAREVRRLRGEVERARGLGEVIGESSLMRQLLAMIDRVAASDATVLIVGESGTGKELLARTIHRVGPRKEGPFVAFDCSRARARACSRPSCSATRRARSPAPTARGAACSARPTAARSSSTRSATSTRRVQNKLLRVLQEREIKPVGGDRPVPIDVRVRRRDQQGPQGARRARHVPRGPLLAARGRADPGAAAARAQGGHPAARRAHPRAPARRREELRRQRGALPDADHREGAAAPQRLSLAGQHPRARERAVARRDPVRRRDDPQPRPRHARPGRRRQAGHAAAPPTSPSASSCRRSISSGSATARRLKDSPTGPSACVERAASRPRCAAIATRRWPRAGSGSAAPASTRR